MASIDFTTELFACPFDPYCLGMCSWIGSPENADMATESMPWSLPEHDHHSAHLLALMSHTCQRLQVALPSQARRSCPSQLKELHQPTQPKPQHGHRTTFNSGWLAEIV